MNIKDYVLRNFALNHLVELEGIDIGYGYEGSHKIEILKASDSYFENRAVDQFPEHSLIEWKGRQIPIFFTNNSDKELFTKKEDGSFQINYDLFGSIFYLLSGWQEITCQAKDSFGRFPYDRSIQKALDIIEIPVVDYYYDILREVLNEAYGLKIKRKLSDKGMLTFISHDIDQCTTGWKEAGFSQLKKMKFFDVAKIALNRLVGKDVWFNFEDILNYNQSRNIHASFFFLTRKGMNTNHQIMNADYDIRDKVFKSVFEQIRAKDCEVGLQGSLDTGLDKKEMELDKNTLPTEAYGNRCHFLLYDLNRLPAILDHCQLEYDNSTCFANHVGFRNSTCSPFYLYDFENERASSCIELPLSIMDRTLSQKKYMHIKQADALKTCQQVISETVKFNGVLSILWHNHHYSNYKFEGWRGALDSILDFVEEQKGEYRSGHEVVELLK